MARQAGRADVEAVVLVEAATEAAALGAGAMAKVAQVGVAQVAEA